MDFLTVRRSRPWKASRVDVLNSDVVALGKNASTAAGIGVAADPAAKLFYAVWVEQGAPRRIHVHVLDESGTARELAPLTLEQTGVVHGVDVFASGADLLMSGFVGT